VAQAASHQVVAVPPLVAKTAPPPVVTPEPAMPAPEPETAPAPASAVDSPPPSTSVTSPPWFWMSAGVGVAGVGVGAAFGVVAKGHDDDAAEYCNGSRCFDERGAAASE